MNMNKIEQLNLKNMFGQRIKRFQKLMRYKIRDILLVSSLYDNYLFEEDGRLYELIREEYQNLNLSHAPELTAVTTASEAIELMNNGKTSFDLIITTLHIEDMHVIDFASEIKNKGINSPIILLAYDNRERKEIQTHYDVSLFDKIFIWQGDYRLLIGIIKYIEDKLNVENDTINAGVQSIILVEDNVKFYSTYLPLIYKVTLKQSQQLLTEGVNLTHKYLRMRARPKILLCTTYEEAWEYYEKFHEYTLGIITDINFKHNGVRDPEAGIKFAIEVRKLHHDIPIVLQSSNPEYKERADEINVGFLLKGSPRLLHDLRYFMLENFGFGDFIFRLPDGTEVGRAVNLRQLEEKLKDVPEESIEYHSARNDFSRWLKARTEFWLADRLRPRKVSDYDSTEGLRKDLIDSLYLYQKLRTRGIITDFNKESYDPRNSFARIGSGSLGGKARGLGFINTLINNYELHNKFPGIEISVPSAVVVATDVFDQFIEENNLFSFALNEEDDKVIAKRFREASFFPPETVEKLKEFLSLIREPLAVRSSSLLEDSQFQPFAGVYQTYMIPNNDSDIDVRLLELLTAIKSVYASQFLRAAKDYMKATSYRLEEEKMAVIVQQLVGTKHHSRFYPDFAGVAKSYNFYPVPPQKSSDGIAYVALGLGQTVVEGGETVRFSPKYPKHLLQFFSTKETIKNAQQKFYALNLNKKISSSDDDPDIFLKNYNLEKAEKDGTLGFVASTYSPDNDAVYDGISRQGTRVVTFAPILKHKVFPLADILELLLELGTWGMGTYVEMEFAVNMNVKPKEFSFLQMRPLVISREVEKLTIENYQKEDLICKSNQVLGNGSIHGIHDIVVVDIEKFERGKSKDVAVEIGKLNKKLLEQRKPYVLVGVGRWGSFDHWLGIPVTWDQISGASAIVESSFKDLEVAPSQGSHFFQNITSFRIGYFTVNSSEKVGFIDWKWLANQTAVEE
ncbi:MAG: PEP/pyruvate-binding domain-containing protein [Melioribacteraceae bacterium]|nr:PEP/pyruvate-binding domain-containing protein [Melioribacteraceae bacterium]